jgi:hypothetical protein
MVKSLLCAGLLLIANVLFPAALKAQSFEVRNAAGVEMTVDQEDRNPALSVTVPDGPKDDRSHKILFPEHVTVRAHGENDARHLYIFRPGTESSAPVWKRDGDSLEYTKEFGPIHFVARATLTEDGILFHYEFVNHSAIDYDMVTAVTDPRFSAVFYDPRLERAYVHTMEGFELLASDTPERLTEALTVWFPVRYLASYTSPIPKDRVQRRSDGITYRYRLGRVDVPMIATLSQDRSWVAATFSRDAGNVWSNPELTCQHADEEAALLHGGEVQTEEKILIFKGSLEDALRKAKGQRPLLK